jgi:hypothetical protein
MQFWHFNLDDRGLWEREVQYVQAHWGWLGDGMLEGASSGIWQPRSPCLHFHAVRISKSALSSFHQDENNTSRRTYDGAVVLVSHDRFMIRTIIEGEPVDPDDSDEEESDHQADITDEHRRRIVYEVKVGKVKQLRGGIAAWETTLEKKLTTAGLL